eukprot:1181063-Prorocentrum_minimum.AAC.3
MATHPPLPVRCNTRNLRLRSNGASAGSVITGQTTPISQDCPYCGIDLLSNCQRVVPLPRDTRIRLYRVTSGSRIGSCGGATMVTLRHRRQQLTEHPPSVPIPGADIEMLCEGPGKHAACTRGSLPTGASCRPPSL